MLDVVNTVNLYHMSLGAELYCFCFLPPHDSAYVRLVKGQDAIGYFTTGVSDQIALLGDDLFYDAQVLEYR